MNQGVMEGAVLAESRKGWEDVSGSGIMLEVEMSEGDVLDMEAGRVKGKGQGGLYLCSLGRWEARPVTNGNNVYSLIILFKA